MERQTRYQRVGLLTDTIKACLRRWNLEFSSDEDVGVGGSVSDNGLR